MIQAATRAELTKQARMRVVTDDVVVSSTKAKGKIITHGIDAAVAENVWAPERTCLNLAGLKMLALTSWR